MRCERAIAVQFRKPYDFWEAQHTTVFETVPVLAERRRWREQVTKCFIFRVAW